MYSHNRIIYTSELLTENELLDKFGLDQPKVGKRAPYFFPAKIQIYIDPAPNLIMNFYALLRIFID